MNSYNYVPLPNAPPAPFVYVAVRNHRANPVEELANQPAQIDSGADQTVIPLAVVKHLALLPYRQLQVAGLGGVLANLDTFVVEIELDNFAPLKVEVVAADEPWILLGRDVDNHFRMEMNGPGNKLEVS